MRHEEYLRDIHPSRNYSVFAFENLFIADDVPDIY